MSAENTPFVDIERATVNFETRFPMEMAILRLGGIHPRGRDREFVNPYTQEPVTEYFGNIGEHCVTAAAFADIITEHFFPGDEALRREIVRRELVHDATKGYEIMRRNAVRAGLVNDAYSPSAYDSIRPILYAQGVAPDVIDYMANAGRETGHNSLPRFVSLVSGRPTLITDDMPSMIVHLVDDMTYTPIVQAGEQAQTRFLTAEERMAASDFPNRYPFLYKEGFGFDALGQPVVGKDVEAGRLLLAYVDTYANWQIWVAGAISDYLVGQALELGPTTTTSQEYIKLVVNDVLRASANQTS